MDDKNKSHMMITALAWVKRGYSKAVVDEAPIPNPEEQKQMIADMEGVEQLINEGEGEDKFDMENYDKEDNIPVFGEDYAELIGKADLEDDGEGDIEMDDEQYPYQVDEDEEDKEDIVIKNTDALIVTAAAEQEYSNLEVYIYEEDNSNLFVHHELMLNAYPLCLEWLPYKPGEKASLSAKGNYIAVGTFKPGIEIWSLDVVDAVAPIMTLGGETKAAANVPLDSMKRKKKMLYYKEGSHLDAVLCLAAHPTQVNFLASGSADRTIKIWDLGTQTCIRTIKNHKEKVQVLEWQPGNDKMLLSAGFDGKGVITNTKNPNEKIYLDFKNTEIESGCWHPTQTNWWFFSFEDGTVKAFDITKPDTPVLDFKAHEQQCTSVACSKANESVLVTVSTDGNINVWDIKNLDESDKPKLIQTKNLKVGGLFTWKFYEDSPWILAAGGMKGELCVWDLEESEYIVKNFQGVDAFNALKQQERDAGVEGRITPDPAGKDDEGESEDSEEMEEEMIEEIINQ